MNYVEHSPEATIVMVRMRMQRHNWCCLGKPSWTVHRPTLTMAPRLVYDCDNSPEVWAPAFGVAFELACDAWLSASWAPRELFPEDLPDDASMSFTAGFTAVVIFSAVPSMSLLAINAIEFNLTPSTESGAFTVEGTEVRVVPVALLWHCGCPRCLALCQSLASTMVKLSRAMACQPGLTREPAANLV